MSLPAVCPILVAPSFHLPNDWRQRIAVGTASEREGDGFFAPSSFRLPDERELELLAPAAMVSAAPRNLEECLCLFRLPQHLCSAWWQLVGRGNENVQGASRGSTPLWGMLPNFWSSRSCLCRPEQPLNYWSACQGFAPSRAGRRRRGWPQALPRTSPGPMTIGPVALSCGAASTLEKSPLRSCSSIRRLLPSASHWNRAKDSVSRQWECSSTVLPWIKRS